MQSVAEAVDPIDDYIRQFSNWGRWGAEDQIGTANFITPDKVVAAASLIRSGKVFSLSLPFDASGPQTGTNGRFNCLRYSVLTGTDHAVGAQMWDGAAIPRNMGAADDAVVLHLQSATHWDSLAHIFHQGKMYNGFPSVAVTASGAQKCGIEVLCDRLVGRAVLLDMPWFKGVSSLEDGYAITVADLDGCAEKAGVKIGEGDILLLRTGQMERCRASVWGTYAGGPAPGLSVQTIPWVADHRIAAIASDTWGVEVRPNEVPDSLQPFHLVTLVYMGLTLGEMFDLDALAKECREDGRFEVFLSTSPLRVTGAVGSPASPLAIK